MGMKAVFLTGHGSNEVVEVGRQPFPVRKAGEAIVRLCAATLNRVDLYMRDSGAGITHAIPLIMGLDGAGIIHESDGGAPHLAPGSAVVLHPGLNCGHCEFCLRGDTVLCSSVQFLGEHRDGTFAEYISVPARNVFPKPTGLGFAEAAALGVNHLTAWRMLFTKARLRAWETVLVFGIGGGVSLAALQIAKQIGARVIVTSRSARKLRQALEMGADHIIDASQSNIARSVLELIGGRGVDVTFENVGQAVWADALKSTVRGGRIVLCGATSGDSPSADLRRLFVRQLQIFGTSLGTLDEFRQLLAFCENTGLQPLIGTRYTMDDAHAALNFLASEEQFGKIALSIGA